MTTQPFLVDCRSCGMTLVATDPSEGAPAPYCFDHGQLNQHENIAVLPDVREFLTERLTLEDCERWQAGAVTPWLQELIDIARLDVQIDYAGGVPATHVAQYHVSIEDR